MINFLGCSAQAIAVANGVTTIALLEVFGRTKDSYPRRCAGHSRRVELSVCNCASAFGPLRRRST